MDTGVEHLVHRLAWSPILLSQQRVEDDENPHLYLAVSHGKVVSTLQSKSTFFLNLFSLEQ